jgi:hypothetical protein
MSRPLHPVAATTSQRSAFERRQTMDRRSPSITKRLHMNGSNRIPRRATIVTTPLLALLAAAAPAATQEGSQDWLERCQQERRNAERVTHCEVREATIAAPSRLVVSAAPNGGIDITGSSRSDVHITARVQSWAETAADARQLASEIQVVTEGGEVRARGPRNTGERNEGWSVSFTVAAPRQIDLELGTVNGGIAVGGISGDLSLATTNGGIRLEGVGGDVDARTTNGGMDVRLAGGRWSGDGLQLQTTNGSIELSVPADFAADLRASTVHGGIETDFPMTVQGRIGRSVEAQIGAGGPPVRLTTTNGAIAIRRQ